MTSVSETIAERRSCRAFTDEPVDPALLRSILDKALRSPSGGNLQPWGIIAVAGEARDALVEPAQTALLANPKGDDEGYPIYPAGLQEPWRSRRYKVGEDLYAALGVARDDKMGRMAWLAQNFAFFGAPVGLFFLVRKEYGHNQWAHTGMLMQSIALLCEEAGLGTCMQEAWALVRPLLRETFALGADEMVYAGMAIGHPDKDAPVNTWRSERAPLDEIISFRGFSE